MDPSIWRTMVDTSESMPELPLDLLLKIACGIDANERFDCLYCSCAMPQCSYPHRKIMLPMLAILQSCDQADQIATAKLHVQQTRLVSVFSCHKV